MTALEAAAIAMAEMVQATRAVRARDDALALRATKDFHELARWVRRLEVLPRSKPRPDEIAEQQPAYQTRHATRRAQQPLHELRPTTAPVNASARRPAARTPAARTPAGKTPASKIPTPAVRRSMAGAPTPRAPEFEPEPKPEPAVAPLPREATPPASPKRGGCTTPSAPSTPYHDCEEMGDAGLVAPVEHSTSSDVAAKPTPNPPSATGSAATSLATPQMDPASPPRSTHTLHRYRSSQATPLPAYSAASPSTDSPSSLSPPKSLRKAPPKAGQAPGAEGTPQETPPFIASPPMSVKRQAYSSNRPAAASDAEEDDTPELSSPLKSCKVNARHVSRFDVAAAATPIASAGLPTAVTPTENHDDDTKSEAPKTATRMGTPEKMGAPEQADEPAVQTPPRETPQRTLRSTPARLARSVEKSPTHRARSVEKSAAKKAAKGAAHEPEAYRANDVPSGAKALRLADFPPVFHYGAGAEQLSALHGAFEGGKEALSIDELLEAATAAGLSKLTRARVALLMEVMTSRGLFAPPRKDAGGVLRWSLAGA